jgi:hypothetical protein
MRTRGILDDYPERVAHVENSRMTSLPRDSHRLRISEMKRPDR